MKCHRFTTHTLTLVLETKIVRHVCTWINNAPLKQEDNLFQCTGTRFRFSAAVRQLLFWAMSMVCGKVLFSGSLIVSLPQCSCDWRRRTGCLTDGREDQLCVTGWGTLGSVGERSLCLQTQWEGFIHQQVLELRAWSVSVWSCGVCAWLEASRKPSDSQHELEARSRDKMNRELEYMFVEVSFLLLIIASTFHSLIK